MTTLWGSWSRTKCFQENLFSNERIWKYTTSKFFQDHLGKVKKKKNREKRQKSKWLAFDIFFLQLLDEGGPDRHALGCSAALQLRQFLKKGLAAESSLWTPLQIAGPSPSLKGIWVDIYMSATPHLTFSKPSIIWSWPDFRISSM